MELELDCAASLEALKTTSSEIVMSRNILKDMAEILLQVIVRVQTSFSMEREQTGPQAPLGPHAFRTCRGFET